MVMPNQFLIIQQEKLVNESMSFQELPDDEMLRITSVGKTDKIQGLQFVQWKQNLINLIKNSDEKALVTRLEYIKKELCPKCRKGLKKFELPKGHGHEAKTFIICEYIIRSLKQDG